MYWRDPIQRCVPTPERPQRRHPRAGSLAQDSTGNAEWRPMQWCPGFEHVSICIYRLQHMNTTVEIVLILVNFREASRRLVKPAGPARSYVLIASSALDNKSFVLCYQSIT